MTRDQLTKLLAGLDRRQLEIFSREFILLSHEHQFAGRDDWTTWLMICGRGAGKTRAGAEWVRAMAEGIKPYAMERVYPIALIGETEHDAREVMVEGVSGIMSLYPNGGGPTWIPSRRRLQWSSGAFAQVFSAEDPDSLRGPQFAAAWLDEVAQTQRAEIVSDHFLQRCWRPIYALELSLIECPAFAITLLHALWVGHEAGINGFASVSALLMTYFGARFGVLGVYVTGRSREKEAAMAGQPTSGLVGQILKTVGKKR